MLRKTSKQTRLTVGVVGNCNHQNLESKSFLIKLSRIRFSPWVKKTINFLLVSSMMVAMLTQAILYLPISMDLKAFIFASSNVYWIILLLALAAFITGFVLIYIGGNKNYTGNILISANGLDFRLNKESFSLDFNHLNSITYHLREDGQWEWKFETESDKFTLRFKEIVERYQADKLLSEHLGNKYDQIVRKK